MEEPEFDVKKEQIMSRLDHAIGCIDEIYKYQINLQQLLKDIQQLVKEY